MRLLAFIFLLFSISAQAQIPNAPSVRDSLETLTGDDRLDAGSVKNVPEAAGMPVLLIHDADVTNSLDGFAGFNGGMVMHNGSTVMVTGTGATGARYTPASLIAGEQYEVVIEITLGTATQVNLIPKWSTPIRTLTTGGLSRTEWTQPAGGQSFNGDFLLTTNGTFTISRFEIFQTNQDATIYSKKGVDDAIAEKIIASQGGTTRYSHDYKDGQTGNVAPFGTGVTATVVDEKLRVQTQAGANQVLGIGPVINTIPGTALVYMDVASVTDPVIVRSSFYETSQGFTISSPGKYLFLLSRTVSSTQATLGRLVIHPTPNDANSPATTIEFNSISIEEYPNLFNETNPLLELGGANNQGIDAAVAIGSGAKVNVRHWSGSEGVGLGGHMAIGVNAEAQKSRATAIGDQSFVPGQSSTAVGFGAVNYVTHGFAGGRTATGGWYFPQGDDVTWSARGTGSESNGTPGVIFENANLYLDNGYAHFLPPAPSGIGVKGFGKKSDGTIQYTLPINRAATGIHGADAHDGRFPQWTNGKVYTDTTEFVWHDRKIYRNISVNNSANIPATSPESWQYLFDDTRYGFGGVDYAGPPELAGPDSKTFYAGPRGSGGSGIAYNVRGNSFYVAGGRGTGTAMGGQLWMQVAVPVAGTGENEKNPLRTVAYFDPDPKILSGTRFFLRDVQSGQSRQVIHRPRKSEHGTRGIISMARLDFASE